MAFDEQTRLASALELIDHENQRDPSRVLFENIQHPTAYIEGLRAHHWAQQLRDDAPEPLLIAARGHHLRRWEVPRSFYPKTREGYLAWRNRLYDFHAEVVGSLTQKVGYTEDEVAEVRRLLRKEAIKVDADAQTYEDAVSLAFLEVRLRTFMESVPEEQLKRALRRTWHKMSRSGQSAALQLNLEPLAAEVLDRALK